jgi:DNA-directed RNA polymerase subunit beta
MTKKTKKTSSLQTSKTANAYRRVRRYFGHIREVAPMPNLIEVQKSSYDQFLQINVSPEKRQMMGLQDVFSSIFSIKDYSGRAQLEFVKYEFGTPEYDVEECLQRGLTFAAPLRVTLRLVVWDLDEDTGARSIRDIKEQDVYMGDMPLMTDNGTFVVNGTERVIVSQMHRSPGVFFDHDKGKNHASGKYIYSSRVIPYRGSWLDFEFDTKDNIYVRIDRRRKLPVTTFLKALPAEGAVNFIDPSYKHDPSNEFIGMSDEEILSTFYSTVTYYLNKTSWSVDFNIEHLKGTKLIENLVDAETGEVIAEAGTKLTPRLIKTLSSKGVKQRLAFVDELIGRFIAVDYIDESTGKVLFEAGDEITEAMVEGFLKEKVKEIKTLAIDYLNVGPYMRHTLAYDKNMSRDEALLDIFRIMRPGEPANIEAAEALFRGLFFDADRYDLSAVGRVKMNARLGLTLEDTVRTLTKRDILSIIQLLIKIKDGKGEVDDIDHLGNRRVRSVGELMENQYRIGLVRMDRSIRERMSAVDIDSVMPHDLVNAKPVAAVVREFFGSSQLSQFMDQTNPLSEITHKRRLSALGPGGLTRDRASFEVRDVHQTHYGRICPIETPEGQNVGLINSLATYARVNKYGFIESPYRRVIEGVVQDEVMYLSAMEEGNYTIAEASAKGDSNNKLTDDLINSRRSGDYILARPEDIDFIDVSPKQIVSVAASMIPFLENDDVTRALMGSNMQRQAVPLVQSEAPIVGTGMEAYVARDSGSVVIAKRSGFINQIDSNRIVIHVDDATKSDQSGVDIYTLLKFQRSNQNTCINQKPLVKVGDYVNAGDIIADGPSMDRGELALGRNVLVAFMSWNGYTFEDSILISERVVRDDVFTSIHLEEFECVARDTKLGEEEITRDIPNVGEEALRNLDETGIVYIGAEVAAGDILVGKITPKGESPTTPEEKLLKAIFGEKASDFRDSSLRVPAGVSGTIVGARVLLRRGVDKDERTLSIERAEIQKMMKDKDSEAAILENSFNDRLRALLLDEVMAKGPKGAKTGVVLDEETLDAFSARQWRQIVIKNEDKMEAVEIVKKHFDIQLENLQKRFEGKVEKLQRGDELAPGVLKVVKIYIAVKRKLQPGDKMAGRHGNKGVVSKIAALEDMPFLEDGTPIDIVLNPLGVPSRMNVGQILETHLGWAASGLGKKVEKALEEYRNQSISEEFEKSLDDVLKDVLDKGTYERAIAPLPFEEKKRIAEDYAKKGLPVSVPVFDGANEEQVSDMLEKAGFDRSGQEILIDGRTGVPFERSVTVGYIYMLKLHHLVDEKIHARSIGPYSLVTQQPLGGKAQFGGQRFGEMEVWALEAYGAAYTLQEMLTVKSDDVSGRTKVYESIVKGDYNLEVGLPESFNVLVKELRSLGLNFELIQNQEV